VLEEEIMVKLRPLLKLVVSVVICIYLYELARSAFYPRKYVVTSPPRARKVERKMKRRKRKGRKFLERKRKKKLLKVPKTITLDVKTSVKIPSKYDPAIPSLEGNFYFTSFLVEVFFLFFLSYYACSDYSSNVLLELKKELFSTRSTQFVLTVENDLPDVSL
jgi:hypothetical protein